VKSFKELISYAKAHPQELTYASSGIGSVQHLAGELFKSRANIDLLHVPFKGGGAGVPALMAGQVSVMFEPIPSAISAVSSGKITALAVTSPTRTEAWPEVPTFAEQGIDGMEVNAWTGLFAPANIPKETLTRLRSAMKAL